MERRRGFTGFFQNKAIATLSADLNSPEGGFWNELFSHKSSFLSMERAITTYTDLVADH